MKDRKSENQFHVVVVSKKTGRVAKRIASGLCESFAMALANGFNQGEQAKPKGGWALVTRLSPRRRGKPKKAG